MGRRYQRKSDRANWDVEVMETAIDAVRQRGMGVKTAAKQFSVPETTLRRKVKNTNATAKQALGRKPTLTLECEDMLVAKLKQMESIGFGLYPEVFMLPYQYF